MPPYLAGRLTEREEFSRLLQQETILENLVLTGLRGVGKTVLLETLKPLAIDEGWLWIGTDLSESSSVTESNLSIRLMADLSVVTSSLVTHMETERQLGFAGVETRVQHSLDYAALLNIWQGTPGLVSDKLKAVLESVWQAIKPLRKRGVIFAYDEAQNLADHADKDQYPLSLLLDVFQSVQRKGMPFMLVLSGLPTLFPKLVAARTFSERMFHVLMLDRLSEGDTSEAVVRPIQDTGCSIQLTGESVQSVFLITRGYPYFIQYVCRDVFDVWLQAAEAGQSLPSIPGDDILRKLDSDFFAGRWARATDRQRDLLTVIAHLKNAASEFTVQEIVLRSKDLGRPFSSSHVSQMLVSLGEAGLVYKNRWGKYSLAVPLLEGFILRQLHEN